MAHGVMRPEDLPREDGQTGTDRQFVSALARGLAVLRSFRRGDVELGNREIAERTGLPKPTVVRLTHTLTRLGYLVQDEVHGRYRLGTGVLALGYAFLADIHVRERARPLMQALADETNASVSLGSRDRLAMVYVETCRGQGHITLRLGIGDRIPIARTAMGRAFLAALPDTERGLLLDQIRRHEPEDFPAIRAGLDQAMRDLAERGFVIPAGDWLPDIAAVGVPLILPDGPLSFALNCGGPAFLFPRDRLEGEVGPKLVALARSLGATG
jgi:DNA-binding IclR family transcriptional regulator